MTTDIDTIIATGMPHIHAYKYRHALNQGYKLKKALVVLSNYDSPWEDKSGMKKFSRTNFAQPVVSC